MKSKNWVLLSLAMVPFTVILTQCIGSATGTDPRGENYAGAQTCRKCHTQVYESYADTWHNNSTQPAGIHNMPQSLKTEENRFRLNDSTEIVVEEQSGKFYQSAYKNKKLLQKKPFDLVFGGNKAETYLYWEGNRLFELPLSYFNNLHSWTNSPGYPGTKANFSRPIVKRCFECHSSYISENRSTGQSLSENLEFEKATLINGIDCERCHGPAAKHVEFHIENPKARKAEFITLFKNLSRGQKLDACAVCHSGNKETYLTTTLNFKIGDTLANFKEPGFSRKSTSSATLDVHGNQYGLLTASKCFIMSRMDCTTCHDPHRKNDRPLKSYATICMSCHQNPERLHALSTLQTQGGLVNKCIDCHMPAQPSDVISIQAVNGKKMVPYFVRNHFIKIYRALPASNRL